MDVPGDPGAFPGMTVDLLHISAGASVEVSVETLHGITLNMVRGVFGTEATHEINTGQGTDVERITPTTKGILFYDMARCRQ